MKLVHVEEMIHQNAPVKNLNVKINAHVEEMIHQNALAKNLLQV